MRKEEDTLSRRIAVLILALIFYAICHCCKSMFCGKKEEQIYSGEFFGSKNRFLNENFW